SFNASIEPFFPVKLFEIPVSSIICKVTPYLFKCAVVYLCPVFRPTHCGSQRRCHRKWHSYSEFLSVGACSYPIVDLFFIHLPYSSRGVATQIKLSHISMKGAIINKSLHLQKNYIFYQEGIREPSNSSSIYFLISSE